MLARQLLKNSIELWKLSNPGKGYLDECDINTEIDKQALLDYLQSEYNFLQITEQDSTTYHYRVVNFFKIHKYNIDKLVDSQHFQYDPLDNFRWKQTTESTRDSNGNYSDNKDGNGQVVNLVSAFNDQPSPSGNKYIDTEHDRNQNSYSEHGDGDASSTVDFDETINRTGHSDKSFQELIEEERRLSQFNIYHWIGKQFAKELLICAW